MRLHRRDRSLRAFSMIEFSAAMAIAGLISAAALSTFSILNHRLIVTAASTRAEDVTKTIVSHFIGRLQEVGGGSLRPWDAVTVEPAPAPARLTAPVTATTGRIWYATALAASVECPIVSQTATTIVSTDACCLGNYFSMKRPTGPDFCPSLLFVEGLLVNGEIRQNRTVKNAILDEVAHTCTLNTVPGPLAFADRGAAGDVVGGMLTPTKLRVVYVDENAKELREAQDTNSDGDYAADEVIVLGDHIHAFQLRLGWDIDADDGVEEDEWTVSDPPSGAERSTLRQVELGVLVGARLHDTSKGNSVSFGGRTYLVPGEHLEVGTSRALFRNLFVFLN